MKNQTMGEKIATLRKENGMTQLDLADKMGVTDKAVSKWERDLSCPDVNTLPRLAALFGISVDELMQCRQETRQGGEGRDLHALIAVILKALTLAMGVGVVVLSLMKRLDLYAGFTMLGLGLAAVGIAQLNGGEK